MSLLSRLRATASLSLAGLFLTPIIASGLTATVTLSNLEQTYDGSPKLPEVTTNPPGLNVTWNFVDPAVVSSPPVAETVYRNTPATLALSYGSLGFSSQSTLGLGDEIRPAGTAKNLTSVDVVLVTWAKALTYPSWALRNPDGWTHPVTITMFDLKNGSLTTKAEITRDIFIPWRPLLLPNGLPYIFNGFAFQAHFDFPAGVVIPEHPVFMVSYNTSSSGFNPIGLLGPYNELNVAIGGGPTIGTDPIPNAALWARNPSTFVYPSTGTSPPMFVIGATDALPPGTPQPPVNSGTWQVTATIDDPVYVGSATAGFTVRPRLAQISLSELTQVTDGFPKPVSYTTVPAGLQVSMTYDGSTDIPYQSGRYAVHATIQDPNYLGVANAELWLGQDLGSWLAPWVQNGMIDPALAGPDDDPDHDSIPNLLEYAFGLDPSSPNQSAIGDVISPAAELRDGSFSLVYRKNLNATDLEYQVEKAAVAGSGLTWDSAVTEDTVLKTEGRIQTIRATLPSATQGPSAFLRLKVVRP